MAIFKMFKKSALEMKNLRCITVTAMMIALSLALKSVTIYVTDDLKISFSFIALATIGMLFGPTVGFLAGTVTDILGLLIQQQMSAFNPIFTFVEAMGGMLYGLFLYNISFNKIENKNGKFFTKSDTLQLLRIVLAKLAVAVVCNIILTPLAMYITGVWAWETMITVKIPARLIKNAIQVPVDCILLFAILPPILAAYKSIFKRNVKAAQ